MKADSVKRKFYRWFPDLDERFERDRDGFYRPKSGHEVEMQYREKMRMKDGQLLNKKRVTGRKQKNSCSEIKDVSSCATITPVSPGKASPIHAFPEFERKEIDSGTNTENNEEAETIIKPQFNQGPMASTSIVEPISPPSALIDYACVTPFLPMGTSLQVGQESNQVEYTSIAEPISPYSISAPFLPMGTSLEVGQESNQAESTLIAKPISPSSILPPFIPMGTSLQIGQESNQVETAIKLEYVEDPMISSSLGMDIEPVDCSFIAKRDIFDDVERSFYGPTLTDCPSITWSCSSSSSSEEQVSHSVSYDTSYSFSHHDINEMLGPDCDAHLSSYIMSDLVNGEMEEAI